ncbi:MAG: cupredoxin domain-containing protein [Nitrospiraceae bacterium]
MDEHETKEPIILTSPARMARGLIIVGVTLAVGAGIVLTFFDEMYANPPPVARIQPTTPPPTPPPPPQAGTTTIAILAGAATEGNPDYDPDDGKVPLGNKVVWNNQDPIPHTATSGTGTDDPNKAKLFDTNVILGGESSDPVELKDAKEGDSIPYFCTIHPYMTSQLTFVAAEQGGPLPPGDAAAGPTIKILLGAVTQGAPDYDPDSITVKKGDKINVVNEDDTLHTITDGTEPGAAAGKLFETGFLEPGKTFTIDTSSLDPKEYDYFCLVHPYMKGKMTVE